VGVFSSIFDLGLQELQLNSYSLGVVLF